MNLAPKPPLILTIILAIIATLTLLPTTSASWSPGYRSCMSDRNVDCREERTLHDQLLSVARGGGHDTNLDKYKPDLTEIEANGYTEEQIWAKTIQNAQNRLIELGQWRTFTLWALSWTCEQNNDYECMRIDHAERMDRGQQPIKYHGKWPFLRVLGCQEIASTLFSIANFVPFFYYYFNLPDQLPQTYWMKPIWFAYTISGMNTWLWSTAFHAKDCMFTERLDYFFATFSILFLLNIVIIRLFKLPRLAWPIPILISSVYFAWHCYTLHYIDFDYDWNMNMMVAMGISYCCLFFLWALINPKAHHRWKIVLANVLILIFASCEVFDFPPYWDIFDAHSVWHGATPICTFLTFSFAIDDAQYLHKIEMTKD